MENRRTYIRESKHGPAVEEQIESARAQGYPWDAEDDMEPIYIDRQPKRKRAATPEGLTERAQMLRAVRQGERIWVYGLDRLGLSGADILEAVATIGREGGLVFDGKEERLYHWTPEALELAAAVRKATDALVLERTTAGRRKAKEQGLIAGAPTKRDSFTPEALVEMERQWHDPTIRSGQAIAKRWKVSVSLGFAAFHPPWLGSPRTTRYRAGGSGDFRQLRLGCAAAGPVL